MRDAINTVLQRQPLSAEAAREAFVQVMGGEADPIQVAGFLVALQAKGVTAAELSAAADVMRHHAVPINVGDINGVVDTCGTGGTGSGSFNISTSAAIVAAACGVRVVKHGNRAASSKTGSADVLETLGVDIDADPAKQLEVAGIAFAYARNHHPAMKNVAAVRKSLGVPTIFNLLGPLTNPAGVKRQLLGVARPSLTQLLAETLLRLGSERAWVVHSDDGQDDLSTSAPALVSEVKDGHVRTWTFDPRPLGLQGSLRDVQADSPAESAAIIRRVFAGDDEGPAHDAIVLNAAAAVVIAGGAESMPEGLDVARHAVASGRAAETLARLSAV